tara:strand:- start:1367 stop:1726 length:360 start_codon:yes stop_codon:yes gene_type:complete
MKITKQVLKKMIKEELKQVHTNEGDIPPQKDALAADTVMDNYKPLRMRLARINTAAEAIQMIGEFLNNLPNAKAPDIVRALRIALKDRVSGEPAGPAAPEHAGATSDGAAAKAAPGLPS